MKNYIIYDGSQQNIDLIKMSILLFDNVFLQLPYFITGQLTKKEYDIINNPDKPIENLFDLNTDNIDITPLYSNNLFNKIDILEKKKIIEYVPPQISVSTLDPSYYSEIFKHVITFSENIFTNILETEDRFERSMEGLPEETKSIRRQFMMMMRKQLGDNIKIYVANSDTKLIDEYSMDVFLNNINIDNLNILRSQKDTRTYELELVKSKLKTRFVNNSNIPMSKYRRKNTKLDLNNTEIQFEWLNNLYTVIFSNIIENSFMGINSISSNQHINKIVATFFGENNKHAQNKIAQNAISIFIPNLSFLTINDILEIKYNAKDEVTAMKKYISELSSKFSPDEILNHDINKLLKRYIEPSIKELEAKIKSMRIGLSQKAIRDIKNPILYAPLVTTFFPDAPLFIPLLVSLSLITTDMALEYNKLKSEVKNHPLYFNLKLRKWS